MLRRLSLHLGRSPLGGVFVLLVVASSIVYAGREVASEPNGNSLAAQRRPTGFPRLVSVDSGNVPPRWKIDGKPATGMKKPHGIALNPNHKEVIVADMRLNAILTFYFPEIF